MRKNCLSAKKVPVPLTGCSLLNCNGPFGRLSRRGCKKIKHGVARARMNCMGPQSSSNRKAWRRDITGRLTTASSPPCQSGPHASPAWSDENVGGRERLASFVHDSPSGHWYLHKSMMSTIYTGSPLPQLIGGEGPGVRGLILTFSCCRCDVAEFPPHPHPLSPRAYSRTV